jgi:transmembrane sensor
LHLERLAAFARGGSAIESSAADLSEDRRHIRPRTRRRWMILATAASVIGIVGLAAWLFREQIQDTWGGVDYVSNHGELKEVTLADGSLLTLNTQTEVRVHYTHARRDIHLIRGEALFNVARDPARPFDVRVGEWTATALGTAFTIHQAQGTATNITVTEGVVELRHADASYVGPPPQLTHNQEALLHGDGSMELLAASEADITRQLAWRRHLVVFTGEPLREALKEMNRYSPRPIVVEDPELGARQIVGVFSTLDTQTFVSGMEATLGVKAVQSNQTIVLRNTN